MQIILLEKIVNLGQFGDVVLEVKPLPRSSRPLTVTSATSAPPGKPRKSRAAGALCATMGGPPGASAAAAS